MTNPVLSLQLQKDAKLFIDAAVINWGREAVTRNVMTFFDRRAKFIAGRISLRMHAHGILKRRTGTLARSIAGRSEIFGGAPAIRVGVLQGPALRYAGPLEVGTKGKNPNSPYPTIRPTKAKALAIPTGPALTPVGVARFEGPRSFPQPLTFIPAKNPGKVIGFLVVNDAAVLKVKGLRGKRKAGADTFGDRFKSGGAVDDRLIAYILMRYVDIAPNYYLRDGFAIEMPKFMVDFTRFLKVMIALSAPGFRAQVAPKIDRLLE